MDSLGGECAERLGEFRLISKREPGEKKEGSFNLEKLQGSGLTTLGPCSLLRYYNGLAFVAATMRRSGWSMVPHGLQMALMLSPKLTCTWFQLLTRELGNTRTRHSHKSRRVNATLAILAGAGNCEMGIV